MTRKHFSQRERTVRQWKAKQSALIDAVIAEELAAELEAALAFEPMLGNVAFLKNMGLSWYVRKVWN